MARIIQHSVTHYDPSKAYNGYTLFAPMGGKNVWLIDMQGRIVHQWKMPHTPGCHGVILPNGNLLYAARLPKRPLPEFGGGGGNIVEVDWDGNLIWKYEDLFLHHSFYRQDNGNIMTLRWVSVPDDIAERVKGGIPGTERKGVLWADSFQEITPDGEVVWEWEAHEHLDPDTDAICPLCKREEWTHGNSCVVLPDGNIMTTFLTLDTLAIIDKSTGDFKWRWGRGELAHPHDPTMLDNGNILVFDNGPHRQGEIQSYSRVLEVNPKTNEIEWEYKSNPSSEFFGSFQSGAQRLPNGNTLICEGPSGRIFEVTAEKELVWDFISPFYYPYVILGHSNVVFRAYRYGPDYAGLRGATLEPGKFEWLNRVYGPKAFGPA